MISKGLFNRLLSQGHYKLALCGKEIKHLQTLNKLWIKWWEFSLKRWDKDLEKKIMFVTTIFSALYNGFRGNFPNYESNSYQTKKSLVETSKLKAFADNKLNVHSKTEICFEVYELSSSESLKIWVVYNSVSLLHNHEPV